MKKNNMNKEFIAELIFIIILILTSIYNLIIGNYEKIFRGALTLVTVIAIYGLYKKSFLKGCKIIYYINLIFVFLSMYLANIWNFYAITNYDKFLHLVSGAVIAIIGYVLFIYLTNEKSRSEMNKLTPMIFVILFATAAAGIWEIWEFTTDSLFGLNAQNNSLVDTMWDIICGTLIGLITSIPIYIHSKGKNVKLIDNIVKDIDRNKK